MRLGGTDLLQKGTMRQERAPLEVTSRWHAAEQLSLDATATEARVPRACALQQEKTLQGDALALQ